MKQLYFRSIQNISQRHSSQMGNTALKVHKNNWTVANSQEIGTNICFLGMSCDSRGPALMSPRGELLQSKAGGSGYRGMQGQFPGVSVSSLLVNFRRICLHIEAGGKREEKGELWSKWIMLESSSQVTVIATSWLQTERLQAWTRLELEFNALLHSDYPVSCKKDGN